MKKCNKCGEQKPLSEFHKKKANKDGLQNACKICRIVENNYQYSKNKPKRLIWQKDYYKNNTENVLDYGKNWRKCNKNNTENYDLIKKYGMTSAQKTKMIISQNNCCAICKLEFKDKRHTHVDHCHTTGKIRSILCHGCNTGIGLLKESPKILKSAIMYLNKHAKKEAA